MQPFEKLDGSKEVVYFRAPTVSDYRNYCGMPESKEQVVATRYLNDLQDVAKNKGGVVNDAALWTMHDRIAALYWIYISSRDNSVITQMYFCNHCKQEHGRQLDLTQLTRMITTASRSMSEPINLPRDKKGIIVPIFGYAQEHIEELKNHRDSVGNDTQEWAIANADVRLYEVAYSFRFMDEQSDLSERELAIKRYEYLLTLEPVKEFQIVAIEIRKTLLEMMHGLASQYDDGEIKLVTPKHDCPVKEGSSTELLLSFHCHQFLPTL